jgi:hypothetical protein
MNWVVLFASQLFVVFYSFFVLEIELAAGGDEGTVYLKARDRFATAVLAKRGCPQQ